MLKFAIDVYNLLLDLFDSIKKPTLKFKSLFLGASITAVFGFTAFSVLTANGYGMGGALGIEDDAQAATAQSNGSATAQQQASNSAGTSKSTVSPQAVSNENKAAADKQAATGQSDVSGAKSFRTPITKDGKFDIGALVAYDAASGEKTYYAGELKLSTNSVTLSKSSKTGAIKIVAPDGSIISPPVESTEDGQSNLSVESSASQTGSAEGYELTVQADSHISNGTYVLHVTAIRGGGSSDTWLYHGFITVTIVD